MKQFAVVILLSAAVAGCGKDEVPNADAGADAAVQDTGGDTSQQNNGEADMTDSTEDSGVTEPDLGDGEDAGAVDMGAADLGGEDAGAEDMGAADMAGDDVGPAGPCAAGFTATVEVAGQVVACAGSTDALNQCDAGDACGAGWHMCTAAEYRAHFENVEPAAVADATYWLSSCIRNGGAPTAPSDMVCADCTGTQTGGDVDVSFSCVNGLTLETDQLYVGLRAGSACTFGGVDEAGNDAYWNAQPSSVLQAGAFCCID